MWIKFRNIPTNSRSVRLGAEPDGRQRLETKRSHWSTPRPCHHTAGKSGAVAVTCPASWSCRSTREYPLVTRNMRPSQQGPHILLTQSHSSLSQGDGILVVAETWSTSGDAGDMTVLRTRNYHEVSSTRFVALVVPAVWRATAQLSVSANSTLLSGLACTAEWLAPRLAST